jgi:hypothetical protein
MTAIEESKRGSNRARKGVQSVFLSLLSFYPRNLTGLFSDVDLRYLPALLRVNNVAFKILDGASKG